jgi:hypothetical protein
MEPTMASYYYLECSDPERIMTYSLPDPNDDQAWYDEVLTEMPELPLQLELQPGYENGTRIPYIGHGVFLKHVAEYLHSHAPETTEILPIVLTSESGDITIEDYAFLRTKGRFRTSDFLAAEKNLPKAALVDAVEFVVHESLVAELEKMGGGTFTFNELK